MENKMTFYISTAAGASVKRFTVSKSFASLLILFFTACPIILGIGIYDYLIKTKSFNLREQEFMSRVSAQVEQITVLHQQVQTLGDKVNTLKTKLLALNHFETQIRVIAGLETDDQNGLVGVGGPTPEDLDTQIDLKEDHNRLIREMHDQTEQLNRSVLTQEERLKDLLKHLGDQRNLLTHTPAIRPVKGITTSEFGLRKSPFTGRNEFHKGLDIANRQGTPIIASADGTVTFVGPKGHLGNLMVISHGHGIVTRYAHIHTFLKKQGEKVKRGDIIAELGNTGLSTGPHLHYEVRLNGTPVDPEKYILN